MATSPLFGWEEPDDVDLVKDGAAAIRTLGNAIDTSMGDLLGGTSGQVLSKNSNTNMDFAWVSPTTGDITGVTAGTGITGGGTSGDVTVSFDQANFGGGQYSAGKNKVINGAFNVWQRGTTVSNPNGTYLADRFLISNLTAVPTSTYSQQSFTAGTAPVSGYESQYFMRYQVTSQGSSTGQAVNHRIEDVRTFANQTVTFSFWAKAAATLTMNDIKIGQNFGSGGSSATETNFTMSSKTVTTSWQRFTGTATVPSISGKTIGTSSYVYLYLEILSSQGAYTFDTWGWQLEAGSTATPFQTASGSVAGELALCQRYYWRTTGQAANSNDLLPATMFSTTSVTGVLRFPVPMRTAATCSFSAAGDFQFVWSAGTSTISGANIDRSSSESLNLRLTTTGLTTNGGGYVAIATGSTKWLEASAEL
jgi:hypothetical protein